jgi:hypothetical protein
MTMSEQSYVVDILMGLQGAGDIYAVEVGNKPKKRPKKVSEASGDSLFIELCFVHMPLHVLLLPDTLLSSGAAEGALLVKESLAVALRPPPTGLAFEGAVMPPLCREETHPEESIDGHDAIAATALSAIKVRG